MKTTFKIICLTMLLLFITACTADKSNINIVLPDNSSTEIVSSVMDSTIENTDSSQPADIYYGDRRLTLQEIEKINEYSRNNVNWQYIFRADFATPQEVEIGALLNVMPAESMLTYNCYYEIKMRKQAGIDLDYYRLEKGLEEYGRVSPQTINSLLLDTINIPLSQAVNRNEFYSEAYDCYYKTRYYEPFPLYQFIDGYIDGDTVVLYDERNCVTLKKQNDKYYIYSNVQLDANYTVDIYRENGISTDTQYFVRDVYFEPQQGKTARYNNALKTYNDFLSGAIEVNGNICEPEKWVEWYDGAETSISDYGLFDLNSDGIPELILYVPYNHYEVYSHDGNRNGTMTEWEVKFDGGMNGPGKIFSDGTAGSGRTSTGASYGFYKYDKNGNCNLIMYFSWYEPWNEYNFNDTQVSKEEFEKLTDPWLDKFDHPADTGAKTYFLEKEYWEIYADKFY